MLGQGREADASAGGERIDWPFVVLLALMSAVVGYRFGMGNQEEHIPLVLRQLDPGYLPSDFYVSTTVDFGPRFYYARLVAALAQLTSLAWAHAILRFATDLGLIAVTYWAAVRVLGASRLGAMIASVLTAMVSGFHLGDATELRYDIFQPATMAIPGMLFAIGLGLRGRPVASASVAAAASLIHPLYGFYGGALGLGTAGLALLLNEDRRLTRAIAWTGAGAAVFGVCLLAFWWWPAQTQVGQIPSEEVVGILGRFRAPHHYFPSAFRAIDYVAAALFVFAAAVAFDRWSKSGAPKRPIVLAAPVIGVAIACLAGTSMDVWPTRTVVTLQPFRTLSVLKWEGYLVIGWLLARYWERRREPFSRGLVALALLSPAGTFPFVAAPSLGVLRWGSRLPRWIGPVPPVLLIAGGVVLLWATVASENGPVRLLCGLGVLLVMTLPSARLRVAGAATAVVMIGMVLTNRPEAGEGPGPLRPVLTMDDLRTANADAARAAARLTPPDAVFVAPPNFGVLRIAGPRALVVEFEAIPYQDLHMREWRERIRRVYGHVTSTGHQARRELDDAYRLVTDAHLRALAREYGATHAVLHAWTPTSLPELYANDRYRIVSLQEVPSANHR